MAAAYRNRAASAGSTTSITATVPSGVVDGDVMVLVVATVGQPTCTTPTGWAPLLNNLAANIGQRLFWRVAASEPSSYSLTLGSAVYSVTTVVAFSGVDPVIPTPSQYAGQTASASASIVSPALGSWASCNGVDVNFAASRVGTAITQPGGYSDTGNTNSGGAGQLEAEASYSILSGVTTVGSVTATTSGGDYNSGQHVFLRSSGSVGTAYAAAAAKTTSLYAARFDSGSGFGAAYSSPSSPSSYPATLASPDRATAVIMGESSPGYDAAAFPFLVASGWGTRYGNAPGAVNYPNGLAAVSGAVAMSGSTTPYLEAWPWSAGFGSKYADPGTLPEADCYSIAFTPSKAAVIVGINASPYIGAWHFASGWGSRYSNPASLPTLMGNALAVSPDGKAVIAGDSSASFLSAYHWDDSTGFGSKYSAPGTALPGSPNSIAFSPDGSVVLFALNSSPYVSAYAFNSTTGFGSKYADPVIGPGVVVYGAAFTPDGKAVVLGISGSPYMAAFQWVPGTGWGSRMNSPLSSPGADMGFPVIMASPPDQYDLSVLSDSPLAYLRLDESKGSVPADSSGNTRTWVYGGTVRQGVQGIGVGGGALGLDGSTGYVGDTADNFMPTGNGSWTAEAWVRVPASANAQAVGWGAYSANQSWFLGWDSSGHMYAVLYGGSNNFLDTASNVSDGALHHIAATWDGTHLVGYLDGVRGSGGILTPGITGAVPASQSIYVGVWSAYMGGSISRVALYGTALSAARIAEHYAIGAAVPGVRLVRHRSV